MVTAIGDLAAFERQDRQVGAIPKGPDFHQPTIAAAPDRGGVRPAAVLAAAALSIGVPALASAASTESTARYKVVKTIKLGTSARGYDPTGITVAADGKTVYVADDWLSPSGAGGVTVISTARNTVTTTITAGSVTGNVALSPDGRTPYALNYTGDTLTQINVATKRVTATIKAGNQPAGLAFSPNGKTLYVVDSDQINNGTKGRVLVILI